MKSLLALALLLFGSSALATDAERESERFISALEAIESEHLPDEVRSQLRAAFKLVERTGRVPENFWVSRSPSTVNDFLPVSFAPYRHITIDLAKTDRAFSQGFMRGNVIDLIYGFNIHIATNEELTWPDSAALEMVLSRDSQYVSFTVDLRRVHDDFAVIYVLDDPFDMLQNVTSGVYELDREAGNTKVRKPNLTIGSINGFDEAIKEAAEKNYPMGIPITYSYRLGNIRASSSYVWLGQQPEVAELRNSTNRELFR